MTQASSDKWMAALRGGAGADHSVAPARRAVYEALPDDAPLAAAEGRAPRASQVGAVWELWSEDPPLPSGLVGYRVEEVVHWDDPPRGDAGPAEERVVFFFVRRRPELSPDAFEKRYREGHAPLARVHHPGIRRYVQNLVREATPGAPEWHAVSQLHFENERALRRRFYRDQASRRAIADDVAGFVDTRSGLVLVTRPVVPAGAS